MKGSLDLSLPEPPRRRSRPGVLSILTFLAAAACLALLVIEKRGAPGTGVPGASAAERLRALATDLEKRTLHAQAAEVWGEYLEEADGLSLEDRGRTLYRRARCLVEAGRPAEAARCLTESEGCNLPRDERRKAAQLLLECLQTLGKEDAYEVVSRAFATGAVEETGTVLARVGEDTVTREEVRETLTEAIEGALRMDGSPLLPAEVSAKAAELADAELKDPERSRRALEQAISAHLLYREGLERGFGSDETTSRTLSRIRRQLVGRRVIDAVIDEAMKAVGDTEISNHYEAHKDRFLEEPSAEFSFARFDAREPAVEALEKLRSSPEAVKLEKAPGPAVAGRPVPGIGVSAEIAAHLLALAEGEASDRPVEHEGKFHIFRVEKKTERRQLSLDEARARVKADLALVKRKEALEALQKTLAGKYPVQLVEPAPSPAPGAPGGDADAKTKDGGPPAAGKEP
jgi:tetratricopeptide (TPR) repeat protein